MKNRHRQQFIIVNFLNNGKNTVQNYVSFRRNKELYVKNLQRINFYSDLLRDMKNSINVSGTLNLTSA